MAGNWGILGTGRIARTFAKALQESEHNTLVAVGSRTAEAANEFATKFNGVTFRFVAWTPVTRSLNVIVT